MGLLNLSGILKTAGAGFAGYGADKQQAVQQAIQQRAADRQARLDGIQELIAARTLRTPVFGDDAYFAGKQKEADIASKVAIDQARGMVPVKVEEQGALEPGAVKQAVDTAKGVAPVTEASHEAARAFDNAHPTPVQPSYTAVTTTAPDGTPHISTLNTKTGELRDTGAAGKEGSTGGISGGAQGLLASGRLAMSYNDLSQLIQQMEHFENDPNGLRKIGGGTAAVGSLSTATPNTESHGLLGAVGNAVTAGASKIAQQKLGGDDPEYQRYLFNAQRAATALASLYPRPNQTVLAVERDLSQAASGGNVGLTADVQARRRGALMEVEALMKKAGLNPSDPLNGHGAGGSSVAGSGDPAFDALMAKYGKKP